LQAAPGPPGPGCATESAFDEPYISGTRTFSRFLGGELDPLTFTEKLEYRASNGAPVEEVLDATLVSNEPEALIDQESRDCAGRHARILPPRRSASVSRKSFSATWLFNLDGQKRGKYRKFGAEKSSEWPGCRLYLPGTLFWFILILLLVIVVFVLVLVVVLEDLIVVFRFQSETNMTHRNLLACIHTVDLMSFVAADVAYVTE
jgi:hypothetical protein